VTGTLGESLVDEIDGQMKNRTGFGPIGARRKQPGERPWPRSMARGTTGEGGSQPRTSAGRRSLVQLMFLCPR